VRIYRPAPPSTQSAKCSSHSWVIDWDILQGAGRWENPLMGWASTADYMQATNLKFGTREQAVAFCERQGESRSMFHVKWMEIGETRRTWDRRRAGWERDARDEIVPFKSTADKRTTVTAEY
jgi:hypothetical protein